MIKNMNEKLDLIKLLNDCPKGMPLNSTIFDGSVTFNGIVDDDLYPIEIKIDNDYEERLNKYGGYNNSPYCKCVIFPKGKTSWEGFQRPFKDEDKNHLWTIQDAKDGDVLAINWYEGYDYWEKIVIFKKYHNEGATSPCVEGYGNTFKNRKLAFHEEVPRFSKTWTSCLEPATKEQRDLLFQTIKEAGYRWNTETKILEKLIVPKFKVGDSIQSKTDNNDKFTITNIDNDKFYYGCRKRYEFMIPVAKQDNWELVPNKFDITTLKPFDKVLVRDDNTSMWINAFYGFYDAVTTEKYEFVASAVHWAQCIPYEGNEHLLGTDDDCDEYYKNWRIN